MRTGPPSPAGFVAPGSPELWPVIVRLPEGGARAFAEDAGVRVPELYANPSSYLAEAAHCTALVNREFINSLQGGGSIARITALPPIDQASVPRAVPEWRERPEMTTGGRDPEAGTVVIGIIDYGIAFAHQRFRRALDQTRIEHFWVQDAAQPAGGALTDPLRELRADPSRQLAEAPVTFVARDAPETDGIGQPPVKVNPVPYGRELTGRAINGLLVRLAAGRLSEDSLYRQVAADQLGERWLRSVLTRTAHGTHVLDLAGGYGLGPEEHTERERRPIIAVQLPESTTADTSGESLDAYALDGIRYILDRADAIARQHGWKPLPVVVNFSYGNVAGPHDGSSDLEQAFDELVRLRRQVAPLQIVLPAGNSNLARLHARVALPRPAPRTPPEDRPFDARSAKLHWRVLPDDATASFMEIWLPRTAAGEPEPGTAEAPSRLSIEIAAPGGELSEPLTEEPGAGLQLRSKEGELLCEARYHFLPGPPGQGGRGMFLIALQPTIRPLGLTAPPLAPAGIWTVWLEQPGDGPAIVVEAWIQRDDRPFGFQRRGRQSHFDEPCYQRFDPQGREIERDGHPVQTASPCHLQRAGSANAIATGEEPIVVGGLLRKEDRSVDYSARSGGARPLPRYLAPSDDSQVHRGVLAAGTRSGSLVTMNGTSVAAPTVARWIADQLAEPAGGAASVGAAAGAASDKRAAGPSGPRPGGRAPVVVRDAQTGDPAPPFLTAGPIETGSS